MQINLFDQLNALWVSSHSSKMASRGLLVVGALSVFSLMTVKEIIFPNKANAQDPNHMNTMKKAAMFSGPTLKVLYW